MLENNDVIGFIGLNHVLMAIMLADTTFYINTAQTAEKEGWNDANKSILLKR